jgi:hypothetical protein
MNGRGAIEFADGREDHGRARLQRDNPLRSMLGRHDKPILHGVGGAEAPAGLGLHRLQFS